MFAWRRTHPTNSTTAQTRQVHRLLALTIAQFVSNAIGISGTVEETHDQNALFLGDEIHRVWKSREKASADVAVYLTIEKWVDLNAVEGRKEFCQKVIAEAWGTLVIPIPTNPGILFQIWKKAKRVSHALSRSRSSSIERSRPGFDLC